MLWILLLLLLLLSFFVCLLLLSFLGSFLICFVLLVFFCCSFNLFVFSEPPLYPLYSPDSWSFSRILKKFSYSSIFFSTAYMICSTNSYTVITRSRSCTVFWAVLFYWFLFYIVTRFHSFERPHQHNVHLHWLPIYSRLDFLRCSSHQSSRCN